MKQTLDLEKHIIDLSEWHTPATDYPEQELGNFRVHHSRYTRGLYRNWGVSGYVFFRVTRPIPITLLQERKGSRWYTWMVDDPPQWWAMQAYAQRARGRVLTTGLGLGLICHELAKNPAVTRITAVEMAPEVVELVGSHIPGGVSIITEDFNNFIQHDRAGWDTIVVDLWVTSGREEKLRALYEGVLPMVPRLKLRYPGASISFHGFHTQSDISPISEEMARLVVELGI